MNTKEIILLFSIQLASNLAYFLITNYIIL